jgi:phosphoglycerate kinase
VVHREQASVTDLANELPHAAGLLVKAEADVFAKVLSNPERPYAVVLGGSKVSDKLKVIDNLISNVDRLLIGGGMCFTFLAAKGYPVGDSLCEPDYIDTCRQLMEGKVPIHLPEDIVGLDAEGVYATFGVRLPNGAKGLDIGPGSAAAFTDIIMDARTVFWNGPMGMFEDARFAAGTRTVAQAVADTKAFTVVGGGDSAAALAQFKLDDEVDHVSTGGGASLEFLELGDLPGLAALRGAPNVK